MSGLKSFFGGLFSDAGSTDSSDNVDVVVIHTHQIIDAINQFAEDLTSIESAADPTFQCPICKESNMICTYPRYCYLHKYPVGNFVFCNICGQCDEIVFHCPNYKLSSKHGENGFDLCFKCGLKHFKLYDDNLENVSKYIPNTKSSNTSNNNNDSDNKVAFQFEMFNQLIKILRQFNDKYFQMLDPFESLGIKKSILLSNEIFNRHKKDHLNSFLNIQTPQSVANMYQKISLKMPGFFDELGANSEELWNNKFLNVIQEIRNSQSKNYQIFKSVVLYNSDNGIISNGIDLRKAIQNAKLKFKSQSKTKNKNKKSRVQLVVLSKIMYLTELETSKIVQLKQVGHENELLNYFKLSVYDWNVLKANAFYEKDSFCINCCLNMPQSKSQQMKTLQCFTHAMQSNIYWLQLKELKNKTTIFQIAQREEEAVVIDYSKVEKDIKPSETSFGDEIENKNEGNDLMTENATTTTLATGTTAMAADTNANTIENDYDDNEMKLDLNDGAPDNQDGDDGNENENKNDDEDNDDGDDGVPVNPRYMVEYARIQCEYLLYQHNNGKLRHLFANTSMARNLHSMIYAFIGRLLFKVSTCKLDLYIAEREYFEKSLQLCVFNNYAHLWYALLLEKFDNKINETMNHFENAIQFGNEISWHYFLYGKFLIKQKYYDKAITVFTNAVQLDSSYKFYSYWLAVAYYRNLLFINAFNCLENALLLCDNDDENGSPRRFETITIGGYTFQQQARHKKKLKPIPLAHSVMLDAVTMYRDCWISQFSPYTSDIDIIDATDATNVNNTNGGNDIVATTGAGGGGVSSSSGNGVTVDSGNVANTNTTSTNSELDVLSIIKRCNTVVTDGNNIELLISGYLRMGLDELLGGEYNQRTDIFARIVYNFVNMYENNMFFTSISVSNLINVKMDDIKEIEQVQTKPMKYVIFWPELTNLTKMIHRAQCSITITTPSAAESSIIDNNEKVSENKNIGMFEFGIVGMESNLVNVVFNNLHSFLSFKKHDDNIKDIFGVSYFVHFNINSSNNKVVNSTFYNGNSQRMIELKKNDLVPNTMDICLDYVQIEIEDVNDSKRQEEIKHESKIEENTMSSIWGNNENESKQGGVDDNENKDNSNATDTGLVLPENDASKLKPKRKTEDMFYLTMKQNNQVMEEANRIKIDSKLKYFVVLGNSPLSRCNFQIVPI